MKRSLTKTQRLGSSQVNSFFKRSSSDRFSVIKTVEMGLFYKRNCLDFSRLAISIGRKYGNAVKRNYVKRIIREIWRNSKDSMRTGYDMVFVVYPHNLTYCGTLEVFMSLLKRATMFHV